MPIRFTTEDDADEVANLVVAAAASNKPEDFDQAGWAYFLSINTPAAMKNRLGDPQRFTLAYEEGGHLMGIITIKANEKLDQLFVLPAVRNRGIARKLWQQAKDICHQRGNPGNFWVRSSTMAISLYERFGFEQVGNRQIENGIVYQLLRLVE